MPGGRSLKLFSDEQLREMTEDLSVYLSEMKGQVTESGLQVCCIFYYNTRKLSIIIVEFFPEAPQPVPEFFLPRVITRLIEYFTSQFIRKIILLCELTLI